MFVNLSFFWVRSYTKPTETLAVALWRSYILNTNDHEFFLSYVDWIGLKRKYIINNIL